MDWDYVVRLSHRRRRRTVGKAAAARGRRTLSEMHRPFTSPPPPSSNRRLCFRYSFQVRPRFRYHFQLSASLCNFARRSAGLGYRKWCPLSEWAVHKHSKQGHAVNLCPTVASTLDNCRRKATRQQSYAVSEKCGSVCQFWGHAPVSSVEHVGCFVGTVGIWWVPSTKYLHQCLGQRDRSRQ